MVDECHALGKYPTKYQKGGAEQISMSEAMFLLSDTMLRGMGGPLKAQQYSLLLRGSGWASRSLAGCQANRQVAAEWGQASGGALRPWGKPVGGLMGAELGRKETPDL